jgi:hypothetical protein
MKITQREKIIFYICLAIAAGSVIYIRVIEPGMISTRDLYSRYLGKREELRRNEEILKKKEIIETDYRQFYSRVTSKQGPDEKFAQIFIDMESMAKKSGVRRLSNIMPLSNEQAMPQAGMYQELKVQLGMETSLEALVSFMYQVLNSPHMFGIEKVQIIPNPEDASILRAQIVVATVFLSRGKQVNKNEITQ